MFPALGLLMVTDALETGFPRLFVSTTSKVVLKFDEPGTSVALMSPTTFNVWVPVPGSLRPMAGPVLLLHAAAIHVTTAASQRLRADTFMSSSRIRLVGSTVACAGGALPALKPDEPV